MLTHRLSYFLIRFFTWPIQWLPLSAIHRLGQWLGPLAYYLLPKFRKRTLSNLSLALNLPADELKSVAKASFVNLIITCLEYPKLFAETKIERIAHCENPERASQLIKEGKPVIFFCGHQSNWEVLFLEGTSRMPGVAIGRPVKNQFLYNWVLSIRQKFGGKIIAPNNAVKEGLRGLKKGAFLGIVGDQGRPDSGYSCPFFGKMAWTSPIPAILSYRTGSPIMVATTRRTHGHYITHYSDPIWPNQELPIEQETDRMMREALSLLEKSILQAPSEWLWAHNRWKQQTLDKIKRPFRQESIAILLPQNHADLESLIPHLKTFRDLYPLEFITLFSPKNARVELADAEIILYENPADLFVNDYRFKLVFNFTGNPLLNKHFKKLSALTVTDLKQLKILARSEENLSILLKKAICHAS